jgi:exodeoxyribonuclease VII large subunit
LAGVDVVIVGRGGGSTEDLWAFNEEPVARAIYHAPVPVISAVGHETDVTIADFVADLRAPTPSAAAEMVVLAKDQFCGRIDRLQDRLRAAARRRIQILTRRIHTVSRQLETFGVDRRLAAVRSKLVNADARMAAAVTRRRHRAKLRLGAAAGRLDTLSPLAVLGRGYAVAWNADKTRVLRDAESVAPGDAVTITLAKGELDCQVRAKT